MRVKRLEIQGFKSFKDKTVIHFDDGVTGIVGPNGCGKSNIVDSFFWVMGEQSNKHMRADGSQDLIFNGSEKYSPLSMAEVTLVLSTGANAATIPDGGSIRDLPAHLRYEEIAITRKLYRTGDSEYQINGQTCRLKDIHELFMDTGAGPKAYSIIEQGQISRIVASKPEDRRMLIEEAAGVVKFKARKKESLRKIEATRQNLLRINDIIVEIERQLNFLERQATKARQYKKFKEELQEKEVLVSRKKLFILKKYSSDIEQRLGAIEISEIENRSALQMAEIKIENLKIQMSEAQQAAEDAQLSLQNLQREISAEDTKAQLHRRQVQELENSNTSLEDENEELSENISRLSEEKTKLEEQVVELEHLFENADSILSGEQEKLDEAKGHAEELGRALDQEKREQIAGMNRQTEISNQVHGLEARVDSLSVQLSGLTTKVKDRELDCEIWGEKANTSRELFNTAASESAALTSTTNTLREKVSTLDTELKQVRADEAKAREDLTKTESKVKTLQDLVSNHEGFKADVQNILKDEGYAQHLKGIFADKLEAFPGYEFCLEGVMRDFLENLFIEDSLKTKELLQNLKEENRGRATFWAFDLIEKRQMARAAHANSDVLARSNVLDLVPEAKPLSEVIRLNTDNAEKILSLFDHFYVVDSLDEALDAFAKTAHLGVSFVTREGDIVDSFGRVSGGSTKSLEGGFISRKAELQKLSEFLEQVTVLAATLKEKLHGIESELSGARQQLDTDMIRLKDLDLQAKSAERDMFSSTEQFERAKADFEKLNAEQTTLSEERKVHWARLDEIRVELTTIENFSREREEIIQQKSASFNEATIRASELQGAIIQLKVDFASAKEKYSHSKQNLERVGTELSSDRARKEDVESMMNRKLDEKDLLAAELIVIEERLADYRERVMTLESKAKECKNEYEIVNHQLTDSFNEQRSAMKNLEEASTELGRLRLEKEKSALEYQMLYQNLFERYGLEESAIAPQNEDDQRAFDELDSSREIELFAEVERLKEKIRKLGEVNLMAVEEYDEQKKRLDFLITQREDLLRSISDLEKAIERINKTSIERFKIAFDEINERFEKIFPIVFGGGWGKLMLTNPEDLVETGVDIIAEPPGKKVGSIQLMSGGEKALTAVALIFSIFLIKPSPFCVLDEVDAPLDDHNVGKFNALLKEMSIRSQFIIITHNKRTMELNDKLYGVTMEEPGVSKMVSIQIQ